MANLNLVVHAGGIRVDREQIEKAMTPAPRGIWRPIPHIRLLGGIQKTLERSGLKVTAEAHALSHEGARYFGLMQLAAAGGDGASASDYGFVVGLRNSHDKTFPAGLAVGSGVFVCDNLAFSGEIEIARKHTTNINRDLPNLIERAVGQIGDARVRQDRRISAYKTTELSDAQAHDFLIRSVDAQVISNRRITDVLQEWREPRHPEFAQGRTAWRLFNAYTEVMKDTNLFERPKTTQALHGLMDTACGLSAVAAN
jgi:hypothetical protein